MAIFQNTIQSGDMSISLRHQAMPMDQLITFASRENPKRGFYFVSKVMGKHIPCQPSKMRQAYENLANMIDQPHEPTLIIGLGEAATGLGAGVADSLSHRMSHPQVLYMYSTRQAVDQEILCTFDEVHSHAPNHILYEPQGYKKQMFNRAKHLVLIDDEMTTGRTISLLAEKVAERMPSVERITIMSLISWISEEREQEIAATMPCPTVFRNLLAGEFSFEKNPNYKADLPTRTESEISSSNARLDTGRTGLLMPHQTIQYDTRGFEQPQVPLLVVGTAEFTFEPFLFAERLERLGHNVKFLATTRTPIALGDAIENKVTFNGTYGDNTIPVNYLYNVPMMGRACLVCYENQEQAEVSGLREVIPDLVPMVLPERGAVSNLPPLQVVAPTQIMNVAAA